MCNRLTFAVLIASLLGLVSGADAGVVIMQCDVGGCGPLQAGWISLGSCGTHSNVGGTGIDVTLATGNPGACDCRDLNGSGPLADVETDLLFADNEKQSPNSDFIITFSNLIPGASYRLLSYHSRTDEGDTTIPGVTITGATVVSVPGSIVQNHAIMDNPAECIFIAGAGDASIRFQGPDGGCAGCQVFLNGFVLELNAPTITFGSDASGGVETISPALVPVNLINPEPGETYTVQYAAIGGTATPGGDYTLTPDTLIFSPGQTTKNISIDIVNDGEPEEDETIILELSNATGLDVVLGVDQHTYTISDTRPKVFFNTATSTGQEDSTPVMIAVELSVASDEIVTVDYAVTGGTATNGVDYILADGTLQFNPLDTTEYISIDIIDDSLEEEVETIVLSLSNPVNATLGTTSQHTYSIIDNEQGVVWDGLVWYYSENSGGPFVNTDGDLEWDPEKEGQFITRIPAQDISDVDDVVEISYWLLTDGDHDCPDCFGCDPYCLDDDITCIAGTSDFRFGMFEADGEYITSDGMGHNNSMFVGYKGYNWRFGPNMLDGPTRWVEYCKGPDKPETHKTGNFAKKPVDSDSLMSINEGLEDYIPGFECPPGTWSLLTLRLKRTSSSSIEMLITYNDRTYTWTDNNSGEQPSMIDVLGVHMRNGRPYDRLVLQTLWQPPPEAWDPSPPDSAGNQSVDVVLSWQAGNCLFRHAVYLGDDYDAVLNATATSTGIFKGYFNPGEETFDPDVDGVDPQPLELWKTYYWRIDEIHSPEPPCSDYPPMTKGNVWSFTTGTDITPAGSPGPADDAENVHPNVVLEWRPGQHAASHDVYFGTDSDAVEAATTSSDDTILSWTPGALAAAHDVYFGTNSYDVNDANTTLTLDTYMGTQNLDANTYGCSGLESAQTYYWRIDEVNDGNIRKGDVWSFAMVEYIVVDDMESYTPGSGSPHPISDEWIYGTVNLTGSALDVGTAPGDPVRQGQQSMKYTYWNGYNFGAGYYSEIERQYPDPCNWTTFGVKALTLYFYGNPNNDAGDMEQMYVGLKDGDGHYAEVRYGDGEDEELNDIRIAQWQVWNIDLQDFNNGGVDLTDVNTVYIGFGDRYNLFIPGGTGTVYFDDISLYPPRCILSYRSEELAAVDLSNNCIVDFADVEIVAGQWLQSGQNTADVYEDSIVDLKDFAVLANSWLAQQLWPE